MAEGRICSPSESGESPSDEPTTRIGYEHPDTLITYPHARNLSACARHKHDRQPMSTPLSSAVGTQIQRRTPQTRRTPGPVPTPPSRHARLAQPHLVPVSSANKRRKQRAYKTRPDHPVRARNVFGSSVRTLAVVRAVLTTIATLTTPLRHCRLL